MPRFISGSWPTCLKPAFFLPRGGAGLASASAPSKPCTAAAFAQPPFPAVQSGNDSAVGAGVSAAPLPHSAGCAPAEPGNSAIAASAIAAIQTWRSGL